MGGRGRTSGEAPENDPAEPTAQTHRNVRFHLEARHPGEDLLEDEIGAGGEASERRCQGSPEKGPLSRTEEFVQDMDPSCHTSHPGGFRENSCRGRGYRQEEVDEDPVEGPVGEGKRPGIAFNEPHILIQAQGTTVGPGKHGRGELEADHLRLPGQPIQIETSPHPHQEDPLPWLDPGTRDGLTAQGPGEGCHHPVVERGPQGVDATKTH